MLAGTSRVHEAAFAELVEWWEDLTGRGTGSAVLLLAAPPGWGSTNLLERFAGVVGRDPLAAQALILRGTDAAAHDTPGAQADWLANRVKAAGLVTERPRLDKLRRYLGVDRGEGIADRTVGAAGIFAAATPLQVAAFMIDLGLGGVSVLRDESASRPASLTRQLAELVARNSTGTPVFVVVDDADLVDVEVAVALVRGLVERIDGQVLVIAVTDPQTSPLTERLQKLQAEQVLAGRVHQLDIDTSTDYLHRQQLVDQIAPDWPQAARVHLTARVRTFAEIFEVLALDGAGRVAAAADQDHQQRIIDQLLDTLVPDDEASWPARIVAWAGGLLHLDQVAAVLAAIGQPTVLGAEVAAMGDWVRLTHPHRRDELARTATGQLVYHPTNPRNVLTSIARRIVTTTDDSVARVAALRPVYHLTTRPYAAYEPGDAALIATLARHLADLGDDQYALAVAEVARDAAYETTDTDALSTSAQLVLELSQHHPAARGQGQVLADQIHDSLDTTTISLETRVWATIVRLNNPDTHTQATAETETIARELDRHDNPTAHWWRLLLAFHTGNTGHPDIAHQLLDPLLTDTTPADTRQLADWILYAIGGPRADLRLYLTTLRHNPPSPDASPEEHLRHNTALAHTNADLSRYQEAIHHGQLELRLREQLIGPDHPDTLSNRRYLASWTGSVGRPREACRLLRQIAADHTRVLGPAHPSTLASRASFAFWTGEAGHYELASQLTARLLPDQTRVFGPDDPRTITARGNLARWTGEAGAHEEARRMLARLLPDHVRVLGADHPHVLTTRVNLACEIGETGDADEARRLLALVVPDRQRVLGPDHPDTLAARVRLARWTGEAGDYEQARDLFAELIPDLVRVLGPDHPETLVTRNNLAYCTAESGDVDEARHLLRDIVLPLARVLGPQHPAARTAYNNLVRWTIDPEKP